MMPFVDVSLNIYPLTKKHGVDSARKTQFFCLQCLIDCHNRQQLLFRQFSGVYGACFVLPVTVSDPCNLPPYAGSKGSSFAVGIAIKGISVAGDRTGSRMGPVTGPSRVPPGRIYPKTSASAIAPLMSFSPPQLYSVIPQHASGIGLFDPFSGDVE